MFIQQEKRVERTDVFLKSVAGRTRLSILSFVSRKEVCVCEIVRALGIRQNLVSHHLAVLKDEGLVSERREGKFILYKANKGEIKERLEELQSIIL